jgi:diadenosine tetraphosphate (Ap4A) HIT family hydrolase
MICIECEKIKNKKLAIYEDDKVIAVLSDKPASAGHIELFPKEHVAIFELVPNETVEHMFSIANKISMICFDTLQSHGTNILINNGVAAGQRATHTKINILPRFENDGLSFQWNTAKASEDDLSTVQASLKHTLESPEEEKKEIKEEVIEEIKEEIPEEENYMLKQLERMP